MKWPLPSKTLFRFGPLDNRTHVELACDLRQWSIGLRWHRAYSGLSDYLNLWIFEFSIPLFTLDVLIRHPKLP